VLLVLAGADFARMFYLSIAVNNAARAGAQYGSQTVITAANASAIIAATRADGSTIPNLTPTASQCTCNSTPSSVAACPSSYCASNPNATTFVVVQASAPFQTLVNYPGIPSSTTVRGEAVMAVQQ
jgi:hypothetical protein